MAAILGTMAGVAATRLTAASNQAIAIISIGRQDQAGQPAYIEEPFGLIERIKSSGFAKTVSARAGISELSTQLPARQYGGGGALEARTLRDLGLIEIRINLPHAESAQKAISAVVDQLLADHEANAAALGENIRSALPLVEKGVSQMVESRDMITKRLANLPQDGQTDEEATRLRSALALTESGLSSLVNSAKDLTILAANVRKTQIVAAPTVTTTSASAFYRIVAMGTLAGVVIAFLLLQLFPGLFRANHPSGMKPASR
ncbi:hypothetical protein NLM31_29900 [Bradyrhizobium sp. CCGUVB4N]|uniref:hypothetical protein n=1 Tax=Bradyrhizobium sp. CCGUVB4N TaxID=2949631 RepID=UPI0020B239B6|nr:hypothetical protein [Bradyrhizobium sp. CCGUVB4N]MCP3384594.1 hypothetical protein [Bradyrhizobium sp. CCGUVB4N]